jgi:hypothetical protein
MPNFMNDQTAAADDTSAEKVAVKIVIASEDAAGGVRAREVSERLAAELLPGTDIASEIWRFNFLRHADVRQVAATTAADADLVVLAARGDEELPEHVKQWIEDWVLLQRNTPAVLVALLDHDMELPGTLSLLCAYLRHAAGRAGMDFYLKTGAGWHADFRPTADEKEPADEDNTFALAEVIPGPSFVRRGRFMAETTVPS